MNSGTSPHHNGRVHDLFTSQDAVELYTERIQSPAFFTPERKVVDRYFSDDGGTVLDVGCGVGRLSHLLHRRGFEVTGIDVSDPLVEKAKSLFPEIDFHVEDVRETSFPTKSFDYVVFSYFGIDYILPKGERIRALKEIHRVLKPSGILMFSSHNSWHPLVPLSLKNLKFCVRDLYDLYLRRKNWGRLFTRYKVEEVPLGDVEIYLTNPAHQWIQLRKCGFTPLDIVGDRESPLRVFERAPHYVAKK